MKVIYINIKNPSKLPWIRSLNIKEDKLNRIENKDVKKKKIVLIKVMS